MNNEVQFLRQPPELTAWQKLIQICEEKRVDPKMLLFPDKYMEGRHVAARASVVKKLRADGWTLQMIRDLCPISERNLIRLTKKD